MEKNEGEILEKNNTVDSNNNKQITKSNNKSNTKKKSTNNNVKNKNTNNKSNNNSSKKKNINSNNKQNTNNNNNNNSKNNNFEVTDNINNSSNSTSSKKEEPTTVKEEIKKDNDSTSSSKNSSLIINEKTETSIDTVSNQLINTKPRKKVNKIVIGVIGCFAILFILFFSTIFALVNSSSDKIVAGTYIKGIDVSGLTRQEAEEKLSSIINKKVSNEYILYFGDYKTSFIPAQAETVFEINSCIDTAYAKARSNNIFADNYTIVFSSLYKTDIIPTFSYNEEFVNNLISEIQEYLPNKLVEPGYYIEDDNVIITKGVDGIIIDSDLLKLKIISCINDFNSETSEIEIPVTNAKAQAIDIEKIHNEIYKEPKDAYYTTEPFAVYPHEIGIDFAISIDEAKELLKENKDSYSIELAYTMPNVTTNQIGTEAFPDLLAEFYTTYSTSNVNRSTNISLASSKIDGTVVMPGETFSYNATVGKRTPQAGFKPAAVYSGGEVTTDYGGGICQVSSTLYNSVLLSNLEIVERYNHGFNPGYVPAGRDATVSWGGPDFKFKNNRNYPIRISCTGERGRITTQIFGLKEQDDYEVEIESYITSYISYKTIERVDPNLDTGESRVIESGSNGCRSVCYRILYQNGSMVSKELLSTDTYNPHNRVIAVGN